MSLVAFGRESTVPVVRSSADPSGEALLIVRGLVQRKADLRELFVQRQREERSREWLRDMLAPLVAAALVPEYPYDSILEACEYLADEHQQLAPTGDAACYLVDKETGRVRALVREDDLHDAGVLPRDSGLEGQALPRLKPALEVALVTHAHDREREATAGALLAERGNQTALLREDGDTRLRVASRSGRTSIARDLSEHEPWTLLRQAGGMAGEFMRRCAVGESFDSTGLTCIEGQATHRSVLGIQDAVTLNLGYDRLGVLKATAPQAWARDIARAVGRKARAILQPPSIDVMDVTEPRLRSQDVWIFDPDLYASVSPQLRHRVFVVNDTETFGFKEQLGFLWVGKEIAVETREASDRWTVTATIHYSLWFDPSRIDVMVLEGVAREATVEGQS